MGARTLQTDDRQTTTGTAIAYSERSLKTAHPNLTKFSVHVCGHGLGLQAHRHADHNILHPYKGEVIKYNIKGA